MTTKKTHTVKKILADKLEELHAKQNARLDEIENFVREELKKINERNKAVNSYVVGESSANSNSIYNMVLTVDAITRVIGEANLLEGFSDKLDATRKLLHEEREKAAVEKMKNDTQQEQPEAAASAQEQQEVAAPTQEQQSE
jgi:hypothetical protein